MQWKYRLCGVLCLLPGTVFSASLADCDSVSYQVIVTNGGMATTQTLSPMGGVLRSIGPLVSFQIAGQPPMAATRPEEEFCVWSGKIKVQRLDTISDSASGRR